MRAQTSWAVAIFGSLLITILLSSCTTNEVKPNIKLTSIVRLSDLLDKQFFCSGVIITPHLALTAAHCVVGRPLDMPSISVSASKGGISTEATVVSYEQRSDMAIIKGNFSSFVTKNVETVPATLEDIYLGNSNLISCGYPYGGNLTCTRVTNARRCVFQFCAQGFLFPGMSGGPIIDLDSGNVVGVNTAVMEDGEIVLSPIVNIFDALQVPIDTQ